MLPYTAPSSTWLTPPTDCCFMWLQLYSFQNILSNRFQQRPWPLVVGVHKEEGGEGGPHLPTVPEALCECMRENINIQNHSESEGTLSLHGLFYPLGSGYHRLQSLHCNCTAEHHLLQISSVKIFRMELSDWSKFVLWVFLHLHLLGWAVR